MQTIVDYLEAGARDIPDQMFCSFLDGAGGVIDRLSYRELHQRSNHVAACLRQTGRVGFGQPVLLVYAPGLDFIVAFLACVKLGAPPVPVPPPDASGLAGGAEKLSHIARDSGAAIALTHEAYLRQLRALAERGSQPAKSLAAAPPGGLSWLSTDRMRGELATYSGTVNATLFLQYTSGSTQSPRGVVVSHDNVIHNCEATLTHRPIGVSWLPHYHDMGLIGYYLFIMLKAGSVYGFSSANFLRRPLLWLETMTKVKATISSAPNFAFEYCLREDKVPARALASLDLGSLRVLMNASEPVRSGTYERFLAKFAPCGLSARASVVFYGLAENTLAVSGDGRVRLTVNTKRMERNDLRIEAPKADGHNQTSLVSCGKPLAGIEVAIVDSSTGVALGEGRIGEVWVTGRSKAQGYFNRPELNASVFAAAIDGNAARVRHLRTGDLGFLHDGELFVCGRLKDMIIIGGRNYYPNDIEAVVERSTRKIRQGGVAAFAIDDGNSGEAIAVLVEVAKSNDLPDLGQIARQIRKYCQVEVALLAIVARGTIARTSSGKVARQECRRRLQADEITVLESRRGQSHAGGDAAIADLIARFDDEDLQQRTLAELGVDSLTLVELSLCIESRLKASVKAKDRRWQEAVFDLRILQTITVRELLKFLRGLAGDGRLPKLSSGRYARRLRAVELEERERMRQDMVLPADIRPDATGQPPDDGPLLLTGATGFLGAFLLEALLRLTDRDVVTLVRAEDDEHAKARTKAALQRTGLLQGKLLEAFDRRVVALRGDIAAPRLGLGGRDWGRLAGEVTGIYHCAAEVDYVRPYRSLRAANVNGMIETIRLAASGTAKALHLVSTTFIFGFAPRAVCWEHECNMEMAELTFGYPQSKWVAEQLAFAAAQRGLATRIYRPSFVTASRSGRYVRGDLMARMFAYMIRHGISTDAINQISLLPVDVCANNLVALSLLEAPALQVFHLTADEYYTMRHACSLISREFGYPFEYLSLERAVDHMNGHCSGTDPLYPLMAFFNHNHRRIERMGGKRYDNRNYRAARERSLLTQPEPPLQETVASLVSYLQGTNLVPAPPRRVLAGGALAAVQPAASAV
ncbi:thioester reductase domain-containing protein [Bradyrhizobium sp.]|uniref:thioester reductase domain-containing protein n=1 Tax=Bradyrhizobium sp. TaxID=376 RepID=UPI003C22A1B4